MNTMARKSNLIILFCILACSTLHAQYRPAAIKTYLSGLGKKGIDTILVYSTGCGECKISAQQTNCDCLGDVLKSVYVIYCKNNKFYKVDLSCCKGETPVQISNITSITYFLSLKGVLKEEHTFYKNLEKNKKFLPPIPTDNPFEEAELIISKKSTIVSLSSYQKEEGYNVWKSYPWIDKEIKLFSLINQDLN